MSVSAWSGYRGAALIASCVLIAAWVLLLPTPALAQDMTADLEITVSDGDVVIESGDVLTYTVVVGNRGPAAAAGVEVFSSLPANTSFIGAGVTEGSCTETGGIVMCEIGYLEDRAAVRLLVSIRIGDLDKTAVAMMFVVSSSTTDSDPMNNSEEELSSTIEVLPLTGVVDGVLLPLAILALAAGVYLIMWSRRSERIHA